MKSNISIRTSKGSTVAAANYLQKDTIFFRIAQMLDNKKYAVKEEKALSGDDDPQFVKDYKFRGKYSSIMVTSYDFAYMLTTLIQREYSYYADTLTKGYGGHFLEYYVGTRDFLLRKIEETICKERLPLLNVRVASDVQSKYIYRNVCDFTTELAEFFGITYSCMIIITSFWALGRLNDLFMIDLAKYIAERVLKADISDSEYDMFTQFQYATSIVVMDFLKSFSKSDYTRAKEVGELYNQLKSIPPHILGYGDTNLSKIGAKEVLTIYNVMSKNLYSIRSYRYTDELKSLMPYVSKNEAKMIGHALQKGEERKATLHDTVAARLEIVGKPTLEHEKHFDEVVLAIMQKETKDNDEYAAVIKAIYSTTFAIYTSFSEYGQVLGAACKLTDEKLEMEKSYEAKLSKAEKTIKIKDEALRKQKEKYKSLLKDCKEAKEKLRLFDKNHLSDLEKTIDRTKSENAELKSQILALSKEIELNSRPESTRIAKLESHISSLESKIDERDDIIDKLNAELSNIPIEGTDLTEEVEQGSDSFDLTSCYDTFEKCKFAFFVPNFVDNSKLIDLFKNSKFILYQENDKTFELGKGSKAAIICTKGLPHCVYWRIKTHCSKYEIPMVIVNSYGTKTMAKAAFDEFFRQKNQAEQCAQPTGTRR